VVPNLDKDQLVAQVLGGPVAPFDLEPIARFPLPGLHRRTRAFVKVQDGCDNACTFCVTTVARGAARSLPVRVVLEDIRSALRGGAQEIVLTGVHLGSWGHDFGERLPALIRAILSETETPRLRLSSLEPWDLDERFFELWRDPRLTPHLHLPLQSGSPSVLRRMLRKTTPDSFRVLAEAARAAIPDLALTTDVIAGFPGETEAEFGETLNFVRELAFAGGHVFTYSPRPGTPAARMKDQVAPKVKKQRTARLREAFAELGVAYRSQFLGRRLPVLWESVIELGETGWRMEGHTGNFIPVVAHAPSPRWNQIESVRLLSFDGDTIRGEIV
jgi:threonylcarbamoyladenosine tRNA methylthiotransferase MtaB